MGQDHMCLGVQSFPHLWYARQVNAKLLFSDPQGQVMEHPYLLATVRSGETLAAPQEKGIPLPKSGRLVHLPGRLPVGIHPQTGEFELVRELTVKGKKMVPHAVGALLPPGFTRTFLPGEVQTPSAPILPQWAYAGAAWTERGPVTWAIHTDKRTHWDPSRFDDEEVRRRVAEWLEKFPSNRVLKQLATCANIYRCMTSRNIFLGRDEGAIPVSVMCNARCVGCISDQPDGGTKASHERMEEGPHADEIALIGTEHLLKAKGRTMVSFGQGCEGEPLTRWKVIAESIRLMRQKTSRGSMNINTNASLPKGLEALFDAGLDAVRVSLNSAVKDLYEAYYKPVNYGFEQVEESLAIARKKKAYLALNLLVFPGITDRAGEVKALIDLVKKYKINQIQTRSLCIDPMQYLEVAHQRGAQGQPLGVREMIAKLKKAAPWLVIGNFARALHERSV